MFPNRRGVWFFLTLDNNLFNVFGSNTMSCFFEASFPIERLADLFTSAVKVVEYFYLCQSPCGSLITLLFISNTGNFHVYERCPSIIGAGYREKVVGDSCSIEEYGR